MSDQETEYTDSQPFTLKEMFVGVSFYGRGLSLFFGIFMILNILVKLRCPGFDANTWWIDFSCLVDDYVSGIILLVSGTLLLAFVFKPVMALFRKYITFICVVILYLVCWINVVVYYVQLYNGDFDAGIPVPISLFISIGCEVVGISVLCNGKCISKNSQKEILITVCTFLSLFLLFPLFQIYLFGKTDYRRKADAAVVLGARVYSDGTLSTAVEDRVRTGCDLYNKGFVKWIILSGGQGDGEIHQTKAMQEYAEQHGVDPGAIILDPGGINTRSTVENTIIIFKERGIVEVLAVSHFYHLPRIRMCYQCNGWDVYTVPARQSRILKKMPFFIFREVAAFWVYYFSMFLT